MIIGVGHVARVGKNTVGDILEREHGFVQLSFADRLKQLALKIDPIVGPNMRLGQIVAEHGYEDAKMLAPEVRIFLQHLGTACRNTFHKNVWVNPIIDRILEDVKKDYVITDVRFANECGGLKELTSIAGLDVRLVKVERPGYGAAGHVSETELVSYPWQYVLRNDGTLDDLGHRVTVMLDAFKADRAVPAPS